ncbi:T9SS type A sorting domain-containing protein [Flavobacterium limi]|uniref:Secretion system C-terminal sorting domain-containing protein n=1 Tax=Flavobacterium limi TaxID=2045105 RepID=A0ABQ1UW15_9FLAO|nr:T9SS type A sorting domain-containing protein [Flavobacterium limi]GGF26505.1 hypothetical protein GCM10011518_39870 [Flavobacterium limi]
MKKKLLILLFPLLSIGQTQIGSDIDGKFVPSAISATTFGSVGSLSSDGTILAIGDYGYGYFFDGTVWIYKNIGGIWTQFGNVFPAGKTGDEMGGSVSLSDDGTIIAVGSSGAWGNGRGSGIVQVYKNISGIWTQIGANINGEWAGDFCGISVSLSSDGSTVAIGSPGNSDKSYHSGSVRVYKNIAGTWTKIGADIDGIDSADNLGSRVSLSNDGSILAIGTLERYVRVYKNVSGTWTLLGNEIKGNNYALSLSGDGSTVALSSAYYTDIYDGKNFKRVDISYVKVLSIINGVWTQLGGDIFKKEGCCAPYTEYSVSLSNDGSILAVGAPGLENGNYFGTARTFKNINGNWIQQGVDILGEANEDKNGTFVTLSKNGTTLAVGAPDNDGNGTDSGSVRVYDLSTVLRSDSFVLNHFSVYPNPASEAVNISLSEGLTLEKVNVYNTSGQLVKTENKNSVSLNSLSKGIYFLEIITDKGKASRKIIVN